MRPESRQFVRRAQLLFLISILFPIIVLFISPDIMEKLGLIRLEEPRLRMIAVSRGVLALVLISAVFLAGGGSIGLKRYSALLPCLAQPT
jgi:hypothetical protein